MNTNFDVVYRAPVRLLSRALLQAGSVLDSHLLRHRMRKAGVGHAYKIATWTMREELETLYRLASSCPAGTIGLELGSHLGASSCFIGAGLKRRGGCLFCVDSWRNEAVGEIERDTFQCFLDNTRNLQSIIRVVRKKTDDVAQSDIDLPLGFVFIDADHLYNAVRRDIDLVTPWMAPDAFLVLHDVTAHRGPSRAMGELLASGDWQLLGHVENLAWLKRAKWTGHTEQPNV